MSIAEIWDSLLQGPGQLRFFIQPIVALVLGIRDGRLDARFGTPPYFLQLLTGKGRRKETFQKGWKAITIPFLVAFAFDALLQIFVLGVFRPLSAAFAGVVLIALPYLVSRGLTNRLMRRRQGRIRRAYP
jgi:tellurite resistance protein TehA-like permease